MCSVQIEVIEPDVRDDANREEKKKKLLSSVYCALLMKLMKNRITHWFGYHCVYVWNMWPWIGCMLFIYCTLSL